MYTNIPTDALIDTIRSLCNTQIRDNQLTKQILDLTKTVLSQNYFNALDNHYIQKTGLAMGAPTSSLLSEIFLQNLESNFILDFLTENKVSGYVRYVDDILIVTNKRTTDINKVFTAFNNITPHMKFIMEKKKSTN
jgi:predicted RNA binding protein with dsRBD fold (UPF0201 family)